MVIRWGDNNQWGRVMNKEDADLFFLCPRTEIKRRGRFGVLYLLRRDIDQCMGIDPNTGQGGGPTALWPGAMAMLAGVDLLAKFFAGSDKVRGNGQRFLKFLECCSDLKNADDRDLIYQLRNSLMHSFGLYSKGKRFILTSGGATELVSKPKPDQYSIDLPILHQKFKEAVSLYREKLNGDEELGTKFDKMFANYGYINIE